LDVKSTNPTATPIRVNNDGSAGTNRGAGFVLSTNGTVKLLFGSRGLIEGSTNQDFGYLAQSGLGHHWFVNAETTTASMILSSANELSLVGKVIKYNNVTTSTESLGVAPLYGYHRSTGQSGAITSQTTYTVGASDGTFVVGADVTVTASTTHNFAVQVGYTDETNTARTLVMTLSTEAGVLVIAITNVTGAGVYLGTSLQIRAKAATAITIKTAGTFTTVTYNMDGRIQQIG
jgi:hypothetical protein